jgi:hypothetical protein
MAERTPRFYWQNYLQFPQTLVVASSEAPSNPRAWTKRGALAEVWRSLPGYNVYVGRNDTITFTEGGSVRTATLTMGNYPTPADYAAHVQARMNAAPGAVNTYSVTYNAGTKFFSIARATGSAALGLRFALTWPSIVTSAHRDLGFPDLDAAPAGTAPAVGTKQSVHSREWLQYELNPATNLDAFLATGHLPFGVGGTMRVQAHATALDPLTTPAITLDVAMSSSDRIAVAHPTPGSFKFIRFVIDDIGNPRGISQLAVPGVFSYYQPTRSVRQGYAEDQVDLSTYARSAAGTFFQDKRPTGKAWQLTFPRLRVTDKAMFDAMQSYLGVGRPFFISLDPQNDPLDSRYVVLGQPFRYQHSVGDGNPPDRWTVAVNIIEAIA